MCGDKVVFARCGENFGWAAKWYLGFVVALYVGNEVGLPFFVMLGVAF